MRRLFQCAPLRVLHLRAIGGFGRCAPRVLASSRLANDICTNICTEVEHDNLKEPLRRSNWAALGCGPTRSPARALSPAAARLAQVESLTSFQSVRLAKGRRRRAAFTEDGGPGRGRGNGLCGPGGGVGACGSLCVCDAAPAAVAAVQCAGRRVCGCLRGAARRRREPAVAKSTCSRGRARRGARVRVRAADVGSMG